MMSACIIMYNMITEDKVETYGSIIDFNVMFILENDMMVNKTKQFHMLFSRHKQIKDKETHYTL